MAAVSGTSILMLSRDPKNFQRWPFSIFQLQPIISNVFGYRQKPWVQQLFSQKSKMDTSSQALSAFSLCTTKKSRAKFLTKQIRVFSAESSEDQALSTTLQSDVQLQGYLDDTVQESISSVKSDSVPHVETSNGKSGFISFYGGTQDNLLGAMNNTSAKERQFPFIWHLGPAVLVTSIMLPPLFFRRIFESVLPDSLLADFLIMFFTEAFFYAGVAVFIQLTDNLQRPFLKFTSSEWGLINKLFRKRGPSVANLLLNVSMPLVCMVIVWEWTGLASLAAFAPYLVGLLIQFAFERYVAHKRTSTWPIVPIIFEVYRLHQLNRAAQLVTSLIFSIKGSEVAAQTMAVNRSLQTLLDVIQVLGIFCIWSLADFLMKLFPSHPECSA
ncbi:uncharacterized protein LOC131065544 isoform X1 [Cryptomeria japonica]|uniref:uncharacterized protein LOC131065544 isoform X1 n=1 Tax=Cryptomeria japonica TaxID=3369 RepID=UPI0025ACFC0D|nr:uncharacterized protein LOC131065544 isoform X1 [Cryptomeria japonica]XP_059075760.1 uncharacterized protein LOC131065544 isoform X1 [Cryptomeria japonica]